MELLSDEVVMKSLLLSFLLLCTPLLANELSLPLQALMDSRSVADLLAQENPNRISLQQTGAFNRAALYQSGNDNLIALLQNGEHQDSIIQQQGEGNRVAALQYGTNNELTLSQYGNDNQAHIFQGGNGSKLEIHQEGDANLLDVGIYSVTPMESPLTIQQTGYGRDLLIGFY
ncbi:hypothetical protein [Ferrimonas sp. SCSIO 43195]|uniref:hypothetical protein n=2 Tax=Ferrimonas TaxID=44011 RepID=UPI000A040AE5|nr:hypothetical protein [Ferrimonas sp. SCSIO 43195]USD37071.1 hypothetical protein J8Z22_19075 [Ferrimonas sp. SCSIO 43195]